MHTLNQLQKGQLKGAVSLKLSEELRTFPIEIFDLADTLEILDLSGNQLSELPTDFGRLTNLKILFCSDNLFTILPEVLGDCPRLSMVGFKSNQIEFVPEKSLSEKLRWLILTNNRVRTLPASIGKCTQMEKLMLAGNRLQELPIELGNCKNLSLLRISSNQLKELPLWLLSMPKLAWLAFSGNLFNKKPILEALPFIDWENVQVNQLLGEGASGLISKAILKSAGQEKEVAIKIFKGTITSDGLPEDEMDISIAAGNHHGLVKLIGQLHQHPAGKKGLVMELIDPVFFNLGMPPSFETCTRDVFKKELSLSVTQVLKIAATIAGIASHLHQKGILHGDLYAHNTLIDPEGNTLFGDFGAASFYDVKDDTFASALEKIEVRAFGYLLDDLLSISNDSVNSELSVLRNEILTEDASSRPSFSEIEQRLSN